MTTIALLFASNVFMTAAWAYGQFTAAQLKILREVITLVVFVGSGWLYLGERIRGNEALMLGAVVVASLPA